MENNNFEIGLAQYKKDQAAKAKDLREHLDGLLKVNNTILEKFKSQNQYDEIESFMRAALEDNTEHEIHNIASKHSILPNDVIEQFLAEDED
jgi:hypothetical protein